jgi:signal transduction histidine kinase
VIRITDSGPGICEGERELVGRRFYRADKSRCAPGVGLGLSLVNAIVKLHGFRFTISGRPGCVAEIAGPRVTAPLMAEQTETEKSWVPAFAGANGKRH